MRNLCTAQDIDWLVAYSTFVPLWERAQQRCARFPLVDLVHVVGQQDAFEGTRRRVLYALYERIAPRGALSGLHRTDLNALERVAVTMQNWPFGPCARSAFCGRIAKRPRPRFLPHPDLCMTLADGPLQTNKSRELRPFACPIATPTLRITCWLCDSH